MKYDLLTVFVILVCITLTALVWGLAILGGLECLRILQHMS